MEKEKKKKKRAAKDSRQQVASDWIQENYLQFNRLRVDTVRQRIQIQTPETSPNPSFKGGEFRVSAPSPFEGGVGGGLPLWRDLTDRDINDMVCLCAAETGATVSDKEIYTVLNSNALPQVHPLREYICRQAPYDPQREPNYIGFLADMVHLTNPDKQAWWRECFSRWFIAMVATWLQDDTVNQQVLVLVGKQGIYKTTWLERLLPPELQHFASKFNGDFNKDDRLRLAEFGLINLDEIDAMTPRELNKMKSLITASDINERNVYNRLKERRLRLASFCASGNKREFLSDITGNRRWLAFEVENIDNPFFAMPSFPYGRLYAQARYMVEEIHYPFWFEQDDIARIEEQNSDFRACESEEQLLPVLFDVPAEGAQDDTGSPQATCSGVSGQVKFLTTAQISQKLIDFGAIKRPMALNRLGMLLTRMGFRRVAKGKQRIYGWIVYQRPTDEIRTNEHFFARQEGE